MNLICPQCNSRLELAGLAEDAEARKLFGLLAQCGPAASALIAYLGLFKPAKQALRWARAWRLAGEVLDMSRAAGTSLDELASACLRTVAALDERRKESGWRPLTNHRYLARVLDAVQAEQAEGGAGSSRAVIPASGPKSKRRAALELLDED